MAWAAWTRKKTKMITVEKCSAEFCIITQHDVNITWIECASCNGQYHSMCKGRTPVEEIAADMEYSCTNCTGQEQIPDTIKWMIEVLLNEEDSFKDMSVESRQKWDDLNASYTNHVGAYEKALIAALDSLNVVRQAYHCNAMVGNRYH